jgi:hypothetical protein
MSQSRQKDFWIKGNHIVIKGVQKQDLPGLVLMGLTYGQLYYSNLRSNCCNLSGVPTSIH